MKRNITKKGEKPKKIKNNNVSIKIKIKFSKGIGGVLFLRQENTLSLSIHSDLQDPILTKKGGE